MIVPGVPVHVLLSRLAHSLETVSLHLRAYDYDEAGRELAEAQRLLVDIQKRAN